MNQGWRPSYKYRGKLGFELGSSDFWASVFPSRQVREGTVGAPVHLSLFSLFIHLKEEDPRALETMRKAEKGVFIPQSKLVGKNSQCFV